MRKFRLLLTCAVFALLAACGGGSDSEDASSITPIVIGGEAQTGTVGTELAQPLTVQFVNSLGAPVSGQLATFVVTGGDGQMFVGAVISDGGGYVRDRWTLGTTAGKQTAELRAVDSSGAAIVFATFTATGTADAPANVSTQAGDGQFGQQVQALPLPVQVKVVDRYGNPAPGATVAFAADSGGSTSPDTAKTNSAGTASAVWTLGLPLDQQNLTATVSGLPSVTFVAFPTRAPTTAPVKILIVAGDGQTVVQHQTPTTPLQVQVVDALQNPVLGAKVTFASGSPDAYVVPTTVPTNGNGIATWDGYVHSAGEVHITASALTLTPADFSLSVSPAGSIFDGQYVTTNTITGPVSSVSPSQPVTLSVQGTVVSMVNQFGMYFTSGTVDLASGAISFYYKPCGNICETDQFTGTLTSSPSGEVTGTGDIFEPIVDSMGQTVGQTHIGTFTIKRQ